MSADNASYVKPGRPGRTWASCSHGDHDECPCNWLRDAEGRRATPEVGGCACSCHTEDLITDNNPKGQS